VGLKKSKSMHLVVHYLCAWPVGLSAEEAPQSYRGERGVLRLQKECREHL